MRWTAICMVPLEATRIEVNTARVTSTLMSGGTYPGRCDGMNDWLEKLAEALGEPPLTQEETGAVLKLAREVAHGVERKLAPPVSFLVGAAMGRRIAEGTPREEAFGEAVRSALAL